VGDSRARTVCILIGRVFDTHHIPMDVFHAKAHPARDLPQ
jgi:hypothetical protein